MHVRSLIATVVLSSGLLGGCATNPADAPVTSTQGTTLVQTAQVTDVRDVTVRGGRPSGIGSFFGALLGSVAGSRIGSGHGSTVASVGGAVAGGMAGQRLEESGKSTASTEITVRLENGEIRQYHVPPGEQYRVGDVVRLSTANGVTRVIR